MMLRTRNFARLAAMLIKLLILLVLLIHTSALQATAGQPNIIFILADDLGYGDLGCYGQQNIRTPHLDQMAREGVRFTDFYAGSTVCAPSRCSLMTGLHQGHAFVRGNAKDNLRPEDLTIAEILQSAGYDTALIGKWGLGHEDSEGIPNRQGFDYFFGYLDQTHAHNYYPTFLWRQQERVRLSNVVPNEGPFGEGCASQRNEYSHDLFAADALRYINEHHRQPFFLYLAFTLPHANNEAHDKGMEIPDSDPAWENYADKDWPAAQRAHAAMISRLDRDVGRILELLKVLEIDEQTVVFFSSDNGPHREGGVDPNFNDSNGPLRGSKRDLTEGGIRVPLLVRWPGTVAAGQISRHVGALWDVLPTLAELAGAGSHVPAGLDGISFAPTLLGRGQQREHDALYWAFYERGGGQALRFGSGQWKAVQQPIHQPVRLYHLESDFGEQNDVAGQHPELVRQAQQLMSDAYSPSERWKFPQP